MTEAADVLELRIHGVNNTSPANMLELRESAIAEYEGDLLGSFWRPAPEAQASLPPSDSGRVPSDVLREAHPRAPAYFKAFDDLRARGVPRARGWIRRGR